MSKVMGEENENAWDGSWKQFIAEKYKDIKEIISTE